MSDDQFTKLFKYIQEFRTDVDKRLETHDTRFDDLTGAIAELSAQVRDYHNEAIVFSHRIDKIRDAVKQIARETGIKLAVEL